MKHLVLFLCIQCIHVLRKALHIDNMCRLNNKPLIFKLAMVCFNAPTTNKALQFGFITIIVLLL